MGVILFFYHYGRYSKNKAYLNIADELLDSVFDSLDITSNISFDQGVTGAAWAIRYLIKNKFIEGNPDETLSDVEDLLFNKYVNDSQSIIPISTIGMYLQSMIVSEVNIEKYEKVISIVLRKYEFYFLCLTIKPRPIIYINSALFVLSILSNFEQYKMEVEKIIFKILLHISNIESLSQIEKNDLNTLYKLLSSIKYHSKEKQYIMENIKNIDDLDLNNKITFDYLWQYFLYFPNEKVFLKLDDVNKYIDSNYTFLPQESSFSIFKGLASVGLNLILNEETSL